MKTTSVKTTHALICPQNNTALVFGLYEQKLPFTTIVYPMPIDVAVSLLLVDFYTAGSSSALKTIAVGFNTPHRYERVGIPEKVCNNIAPYQECFVTTIEASDVCYEVGILQQEWSFVAFLRKKDDDYRYWFHVQYNHSGSKNKWMKLGEFATFEEIYVQDLVGEW